MVIWAKLNKTKHGAKACGIKNKYVILRIGNGSELPEVHLCASCTTRADGQGDNDKVH
jgi:hypothetical protein